MNKHVAFLRAVNVGGHAIVKEVYNLRRDKDKSVFSNNFIEKILKAPATTRNLTTIKKIAEKYK